MFLLFLNFGNNLFFVNVFYLFDVQELLCLLLLFIKKKKTILLDITNANIIQLCHADVLT